MQIPVSVRDCRTAVSAAIGAIQGQFNEAAEAHRKSAFEALLNGAVHNGLEVTDARRQEMKEMVDRDVEHLMSHNPAKQTVHLLEVQLLMLDYTEEDTVIIDENDFNLLKDHLPAREREQEAAA